MIFMTREQMREYDRLAIEEYGVPGALLMENAGRGAADIVEQYLRPSGAAAIICGGGNNGGDGFVIARHLTNRGYFVRTYLVAEKEKLTGDAALNMAIFEKMNGEIVDCRAPEALALRLDELETSDVIVDAMLGTGLTKEVRGPIHDAIRLINLAPPPKVAVDIPSGISADNGRVLGVAVQATATATFGFLKRGLLLFPGAEHAGAVHVIDIGAPAQAADQAGHDGKLLQEDDVAFLITPRKADGYKDSYGHALLVAGSAGQTGPAILCAEAALRAGAGCVTLISTQDERSVLESQTTGLVIDHLVENTDAPLTEQATSKLESLMEGKQVIAVGPGCTSGPAMTSIVSKLLETATQPLVLDGDALDILAFVPEAADEIERPLVLTPHPGEMARLAGIDIDAVQADRPGVAREQAERFKAIVVLKGAHTIVASPDGALFINPTGNPGMATAGMGAALTGLIAAFLAQGHDPLEASCMSVYLHGLAGNRAANLRGERGLVPMDVIDFVPSILLAWENGQIVGNS